MPLISQANELNLNKQSDKQIEAYDNYFGENHDVHINKVKELVAVPALAMVPEHAPDLKKEGEYLVKELTAIGLKNAKYHPADSFTSMVENGHE